MKKSVLFPVLALSLLLCSCGSEGAASGPNDQTGQNTVCFAMDTAMNLTVYGDTPTDESRALDAAVAEIERLDALLTRHEPGSAISKLNESQGKPVSMDREALALLKEGVRYSQETDGALDLTVAPIMDAWNFTGDTPRVPSREELDELLTHVGDERIVFDGDTVTLEPGMAVDLGSIAKGYTSQRLADLFGEYNIDSAMVSLGGNVYVHGNKPGGSPWRVAVEDPFDRENYLGVLNLSDRFVITSGGYQRFFEQDGVTYYHIIDPKTGDVARSGLASVTIVCEDGTMGDALSTALFVKGLDGALDFWKQSEEDFDMILCDTEGHVYLTEGLEDVFDSSISENSYEYTICRRT